MQASFCKFHHQLPYSVLKLRINMYIRVVVGSETFQYRTRGRLDSILNLHSFKFWLMLPIFFVHDQVDELGSKTFCPVWMRWWSIFLIITGVSFALNIVTTAFGACTMNHIGGQARISCVNCVNFFGAQKVTLVYYTKTPNRLPNLRLIVCLIVCLIWLSVICRAAMAGTIGNRHARERTFPPPGSLGDLGGHLRSK